ncbi:MAG: hypothetical protein LPJ87_01215 [Zoogloeaceae bacterium]|nr:hypothetical protein [Zoogloeaceae bacterium]
MLTKVFFDPGYMPVGELSALTQQYPGLKLIRHRKKDVAAYEKHGLEMLVYPAPGVSGVKSRLNEDPEKVWSSIINDHQTSVLFDRTVKSASEVFKFNELMLMCCTYQHWLEQEAPDCIVFTVTPHNIKTWTLSKVAEALGIPVLYFQESFFPWRQFLLKGLKRGPEIVCPSASMALEVEQKFFSQYVSKKKGGREEAMPLYEIKRLKKNNWKLLNFKAELGYFLKKPLSALEKVRSYLCYEGLAGDVSRINYVALFLHYQPERSTIPEGYGFGVQLAAILALQQALPDDTYLVVREHPSTYTYNFSKNYRNRDFYQTIASIDRVIIASVNSDPYGIMDNSIAVASITGTVIGEALVRGKPGIAFGEGIMQAFSSNRLHKYESVEKLRSFLSGVTELEDEGVAASFESVRVSSFSGVEDSDVEYDESRRLKYLIASVRNGMNQLLGGALKV